MIREVVPAYKIFFIFISIAACLRPGNYASIVSNIRTIDTFDAIWQEMPNIDENWLIIFDRDDTLVQGIDHIAPAARQEFIHLWMQVYVTQAAEERDAIITQISQARLRLVDEHILLLIKELHRKGAKVIVLTRGCHGLNVLGFYVEDLCISTLKAIGIDLAQSFPHVPLLALSNLQRNNISPLFKAGILFSSPFDKGETLEVFLQEIGWRPECIVFIDDKRRWVEDVQRMATKLEIPFLGFEYTGAELLSPPDIRLLCFQLCYLLEQDLL